MELEFRPLFLWRKKSQNNPRNEERNQEYREVPFNWRHVFFTDHEVLSMPLTNIDIRILFVILRFSHGKCLLKGSTSLTRGLVYMTTGLGFEPLSYPTPQGIWSFHQFFRLLHRESILLHNLNDFQSMKPP